MIGAVLFQLGTLGAGNHYAEIQVVDEIYNPYNARKMGIDRKGQVCIMIHCGSRGLGHQVATGRKTHHYLAVEVPVGVMVAETAHGKWEMNVGFLLLGRVGGICKVKTGF